MRFSKKFIAATAEYADFGRLVPAPALRKTFTVSKAKTGELTLCGLGFYRLFLNGRELTRGHLSPYISNPDDILYYDTYDIAPYLLTGENTLAILLGNGMQNAFGGAIWDFHLADFRSAPKVALACDITMDNGEILSFEGDDTFRTAPSPILMDDLRAGEFYDARLEEGMEGWMLNGFDDSLWKPAISAETPRGICRLCEVEPILPERELSPVSIEWNSAVPPTNRRASLPKFPLTDAEREGYLYDFGINGAGLIRLRVRGKRGQKITLQFGEERMEDGRLALRATNFLPERYGHRIEYTCRGEGEEVYVPSFTYFGFRYCLVGGIEKEQATESLLTYILMNTRLESRASFSCSDEMANKIYEAVLVSDKANFYHFPTDCPHREKNGWTGDAALSAEQMLLNFSVEKNLREWMRNICLAQRADGAMPGIVPTGGWGFTWGNGPAWDIVLVNLPYFVWLYRGDTEILRESASSILRYLHYITTVRDEKGLVHIGLGDWCHCMRKPEQPKTSLAFTDTVTCMDICEKARIIFEAIGMKPQAEFAASVHASLRESARKHLITADGTTADRTETAQAMAIYYDLFDPAEKEEAFRVLLQIIEEEGGSFDCGILGLRVLFHVLSAYGRTDIAYRMITKKELPSYGYMIENGATSLWEQFPPRGKEGVTSFNHHFFGDVASWFMQNLAGICLNPEREGVNTVLLAPKCIEALSFVKGSHISPLGKIEAEWHRAGENILYTVTVPKGMKATLKTEAPYRLADGRTGRVPVAEGTTVFTLVKGE